jgi:hypothetical protein
MPRILLEKQKSFWHLPEPTGTFPSEEGLVRLRSLATGLVLTLQVKRIHRHFRIS